MWNAKQQSLEKEPRLPIFDITCHSSLELFFFSCIWFITLLYLCRFPLAPSFVSASRTEGLIVDNQESTVCFIFPSLSLSVLFFICDLPVPKKNTTATTQNEDRQFLRKPKAKKKCKTSEDATIAGERRLRCQQRQLAVSDFFYWRGFLSSSTTLPVWLRRWGLFPWKVSIRFKQISFNYLGFISGETERSVLQFKFSFFSALMKFKRSHSIIKMEMERNISMDQLTLSAKKQISENRGRLKIAGAFWWMALSLELCDESFEQIPKQLHKNLSKINFLSLIASWIKLCFWPHFMDRSIVISAIVLTSQRFNLRSGV